MKASLKSIVRKRAKFCCEYCFAQEQYTQDVFSGDHILPRSRGGQMVAENLVSACQACNNRKGNRTPEEARMPLLTNPAALFYGLERAELRQASTTRPEWRKYLFLEHAEDEQVAMTA